MSEIDYKTAFERCAKSLALSNKAMRECQLLLCPQKQWGDCAKDLKDGEKCACGFEDGPFANAVPKNREADRLRARVAELEAVLREARQYVIDAESDEDPETQTNSARLLIAIDVVLAQAPAPPTDAKEKP